MRYIAAYAGLLSMLLLAGCPRSYPPGSAPAPTGSATHPWDQEGWQPPQLPGSGGQGSTAGDQELQRPNLPGPLLPDTDTLDPQQLAGRWLQVCQAGAERVELIPAAEMDLLELEANGQAAYTLVLDGQVSRLEGTWRKLPGGALALAMGGNDEDQFFGLLARGQFLYLWIYEHQQGYWYARLPQESTPQIMVNRFSTSRGELKITQTMQQQFSGEVVTEQSRLEVSGHYNGGVLTLRWQDKPSQAAGYAMFIVDPDWQSLAGVYWLDNWRAAPVEGEWNGTAAP